MSLVSGKEFNAMHPNTTFYKLLHKDLTHFGFTFQHGINTDTLPFKPSGECSAGGLYFTDKENLHEWLYKKHYICKVSIPDESQVYCEKDKYKTDSFFLDLDNKIEINLWEGWNDLKYCETALQKDGFALRYMNVENLTPSLIIVATNQCKAPLNFILPQKQTPEICLSVVKQNGFGLYLVRNDLLTPELCLASVKQKGSAIYYVADDLLTPELCLEAVKQNGRALKYVKDEFITDELVLAAVEQDVIVFTVLNQRLKSITPELIELLVKQNGFVLQYIKYVDQTPEMCEWAVQQDGQALQFVKDEFITPELCLTAVKQIGYAIKFVKDEFLTPELCLTAVKQHGYAIEFVKDEFLTLELCELAVKQNGNYIKYIKDEFITFELFKLAVANGLTKQFDVNFTFSKKPNLCKSAVQYDGYWLNYMKQTLELCIIAVKQNSCAIYYVNKEFLTPEIKYYASIQYQVSSFFENRFERFCRVFS